MSRGIPPLTRSGLAEIERRHKNPAARRLLTEIWRLRMIEVRAEGLIRALADERVDLGSVVEPLAVGLRSALGLPFDAVAVRSLPRRDNIGVWQADRVMTEAHLARERELGRALNPIKWGQVSDRR